MKIYAQQMLLSKTSIGTTNNQVTNPQNSRTINQNRINPSFQLRFPEPEKIVDELHHFAPIDYKLHKCMGMIPEGDMTFKLLFAPFLLSYAAVNNYSIPDNSFFRSIEYVEYNNAPCTYAGERFIPVSSLDNVCLMQNTYRKRGEPDWGCFDDKIDSHEKLEKALLPFYLVEYYEMAGLGSCLLKDYCPDDKKNIYYFFHYRMDLKKEGKNCSLSDLPIEEMSRKFTELINKGDRAIAQYITDSDPALREDIKKFQFFKYNT